MSSQSQQYRHFRPSNIIGSSTDTMTSQTTTTSTTSTTSTSFVTSSQALVILKQRDSDLIPEEIAFKTALQHHEALLDEPGASNADRIASLETMRDALEALEYWEDALLIEEELEGLATCALESAACIFRQGKLLVRQELDLQGYARYQKALEIFTLEHNNRNNVAAAAAAAVVDSDDEDDDVYFHADIGNVIVAMAGVHFSQGNVDECLTTLDAAEDHFRNHGTKKSERPSFLSWTPQTEPHPDLVKCLDNQGMMLRFQEDYYGALTKYEEALDVLGDRDVEKRQALQMHIADMLKCVDDIDGAITYYEKILAEDKARRRRQRRRRQSNGDDDVDDDEEDNTHEDEETVFDGIVLYNLGTLHSQQRQLDLAQDEMTRALEIQKRFLGENNQEVAATLTALGSVYGVQGEKRHAIECFQQALLIERMYAEDDNDPQVLQLLRNISILHGEKVPKWDD